MIVLDTCAIIWDAVAPQKLPLKAINAINTADTNHQLIISDISFWEIAMLISKQRLVIGANAATFLNLFLASRHVKVQLITPEIAELSTHFDATINNDPADRIIAATTIMCHGSLVTADTNLRKAVQLTTIW